MPSAAASSRGTAVEDEEFPGSRRGRSGTPASAKGARTASSTSCGRRKVSGCSSTLRITDVQRVLPLRQGKLGPVFSDGSCSLVHEAELSFEALLPSGRFCIGEGVSHPVFDELEGDGVRFKSFCFSDERGFTPPDMINMLEKVRKDPWGRIMYHTFNSIMPWSTFGCKQIFDQTTVYGKLNYLSYTTGHGPKVLPPSAEHDEWLRKYRLKRTFGTFPGGLPCSTPILFAAEEDVRHRGGVGQVDASRGR
eukprot:s2206_g6.t1